MRKRNLSSDCRRRRGLGILGAVLAGVGLLACATYQHNLTRGQRLYQQHEYDRALAMWRLLEPDVDVLTWEEQARYAYLRGMTDYRLKYQDDARHWLAIAKAVNQTHPGSLQDDWVDRVEVVLTELNGEIYGLSSEQSTAEAVVGK